MTENGAGQKKEKAGNRVYLLAVHPVEKHALHFNPFVCVFFFCLVLFSKLKKTIPFFKSA